MGGGSLGVAGFKPTNSDESLKMIALGKFYSTNLCTFWCKALFSLILPVVRH